MTPEPWNRCRAYAVVILIRFADALLEAARPLERWPRAYVVMLAITERVVSMGKRIAVGGKYDAPPPL
jgi:hypothetical protein